MFCCCSNSSGSRCLKSALGALLFTVFLFFGAAGMAQNSDRKIVKKVPVTYPSILKSRGIGGVVRLKVFVKPEKRHMGMVFQSYALWPHMTVFENVAYPLKLRGIKGNEAEKKVAEVLGLVGLSGLQERPAPALSGGQQQRVALARALVFSPRVLLLDEPLSNLDAQLREEMRRELKALQQRLHITVLFVTHDQIEALSLSGRIAIMKAGQLEQVGTPEDVYFRPATPWCRRRPPTTSSPLPRHATRARRWWCRARARAPT